MSRLLKLDTYNKIQGRLHFSRPSPKWKKKKKNLEFLIDGQEKSEFLFYK